MHARNLHKAQTAYSQMTAADSNHAEVLREDVSIHAVVRVIGAHTHDLSDAERKELTALARIVSARAGANRAKELRALGLEVDGHGE